MISQEIKRSGVFLFFRNPMSKDLLTS